MDHIDIENAIKHSRKTLLDEGKLKAGQTLPIGYARTALKDIKFRGGRSMSVLHQLDIRSTSAFRNWIEGEDRDQAAVADQVVLERKGSILSMDEKDLEASKEIQPPGSKDNSQDLSASIASLEVAVKQLTKKIVEGPVLQV